MGIPVPVPVRVCLERHVGKGAVNALLKEAYKQKVKGGEPVNTREDAIKVLNNLGRHGFILRVNRGDPIGGKGGPRLLQANPQQELKEDSYYMWIWEGSQLKLYLGAVGLVITVLAAVLFPLWPEFLRLGVWYLSIGVLGLLGVFFGIAIVRLIFYLITIIILPRGIWMFPNLFEDVGIIDSFIPFWAYDEPKKSKKAKPSVTQDASSAAAATAGVAADPAPVAAAAATTEKE